MPSEGAREGLSVHMKKPSFSGKFAIGLPAKVETAIFAAHSLW